jgi:hypothetical protein
LGDNNCLSQRVSHVSIEGAAWGGALPDIIAGYSRGSFMWDERIISLLFHAIFVAVSLYLWMLFFWKGAVSLLILLDTVLTMDAGSVEPLDSPT